MNWREQIEAQIAGGCGSHSCRIEKPKGVGVNGPCRCWARLLELRPVVQALLDVAVAAERLSLIGSHQYDLDQELLTALDKLREVGDE